MPSAPRPQDPAATAIVAAEAPQVVRRVATSLDVLSFPYTILEPCASRLMTCPHGALYCLGSRVASELPRFPGPTIVVLYGAQLTDEAVLSLRGRRLCTLHLDGLTPTSLLRAMISARSGTETGSIAGQLQRLRRFERVPPDLITAFLEHPAAMTRLRDLRRALGPISRESAQQLVRSSGFPRAEHLFTALRCAAWVLIKSDGVNRKEISKYLGICDRTSFRRACRRAGIPALHAELCPEAFDA